MRQKAQLVVETVRTSGEENERTWAGNLQTAPWPNSILSLEHSSDGLVLK